MSSKGNGYTVHLMNAAGDLLGLTDTTAGQPVAELSGHDAGQILFTKTGFRMDADKGRAVRNRVRWFVVTSPDGRRTAHGRPTDGQNAGGLVRYLDFSDGEREALTLHHEATGAGMPLDQLGKPYPAKGVSAPESDAEPVKAPAPRVSAAEAPRAPRATVKTSTGADRVGMTSVEMLTVGADNPTGEPVYVKTLPERHGMHGGKTVREVFGHDGYWFTIPGSFPASLPDEFHITRQTFAVFQSPDVVRGALVWVAHHLWRRERHGIRRGTSTESRRMAVRAAVSDYSRWAMRRGAEILDNRAAINSQAPTAPVRVTAEGGAWIVHVHCLCGRLDGAESFASAREAASEWVDQDPGTPWALCAHSPAAFVTGGSGERYAVTGTGRGDGRKTPAGFALLHGVHDDGRTASVPLRTVDTRRL